MDSQNSGIIGRDLGVIIVYRGEALCPEMNSIYALAYAFYRCEASHGGTVPLALTWPTWRECRRALSRVLHPRAKTQQAIAFVWQDYRWTSVLLSSGSFAAEKVGGGRSLDAGKELLRQRRCDGRWPSVPSFSEGHTSQCSFVKGCFEFRWRVRAGLQWEDVLGWPVEEGWVTKPG